MPSDNQKTAKELYESLAAQDFEAASALVCADIVVTTVATGDQYEGRGGFLEFARGWLVAVPDLCFHRIHFSVAQNRVVAEYQIRGSHTGPLVTRQGHIPPTGMDIQLSCCDVLEFGEDGVQQIRSYFDSASLLRQLGLLDGTPLHAPERRAPLELYAQPVESHAPQRNKAVVQRFVQEVFNRQNPGAAADTCATGYIWHGGSFGETGSLAAYQNVIATLLVAFPDLHVELLDAVAEEDRVVVRFAMTGTHLGSFQGIDPTFRQLKSGGTNTYRFEDSRMVEEWWGGDVLALLQQMDAAPPSLPIGS